jgi:hypothetical protein
VLAALLAPAAAASATDRLGLEAFVGYSFARIDDVGRHGLNAGLSFDLVGPLSAFADASAHWGDKEGTSRSDLTAMAGPGFRFGKRAGTVFFVRALAGLVRSRASIGVLDVDISETDDRLGVLAGGGVDVPLGSRLVVRGQGDYLWNDADVESGSRGGFRASLGLVYHFGGRR